MEQLVDQNANKNAPKLIQIIIDLGIIEENIAINNLYCNFLNLSNFVCSINSPKQK